MDFAGIILQMGNVLVMAMHVKAGKYLLVISLCVCFGLAFFF